LSEVWEERIVSDVVLGVFKGVEKATVGRVGMKVFMKWRWCVCVINKVCYNKGFVGGV
jgi:hypothetical protein